MSDEEPAEEAENEASFRERVEQIRQEQAEGGEDPEERRGGLEDMMGGGMGGNPFAQMMGGMMGGGPAGGDLDSERIVRELARLREEVRDVGSTLERIAEALEED